MTDRNIILVTFDSLRADHCSHHGYERDTTPTLSEMGEEGIVYENAIASSVPTGPSMIGVHTGELCPIDAGDFTQEKWRKEFNRRQTLAGTLSANGYDTAAFHANPYGSSYFGFEKGFDSFNDFVKKTELETLTTDSTAKAYLATVQRLFRGEGTNITWEKLYEPIREWIADASEPYFLWVLLLDPHTPYLPPKDRRKWCNAGKLRLIFAHWRAQNRDWTIDDPNSALVERLRNAYDDEVRYADQFLKRLRADTRDDDPIIIAHGDHGEGFSEHRYLRHPPELHEELVHVPLVIHNAEQSGYVTDPVSLRDIPATVTDLVGIVEQFPGKSVREDGHDWVYTQVFKSGEPKGAIRTKEWKYIQTSPSDGELYHLRADPNEQENVIDENRELATELQTLLDNRVVDQVERKAIHETTNEHQLEPTQ